jgi:uncharacterized metal-binding protein YceD (DUF177 family)
VSKRGLYAVRISGIGEGDHHFSFELDQRFFASFNNPELQNGSVQGDVVLQKKQGFLSLHFTLTGEVELECDRCLDPFKAGISDSQAVFVKIGDTPGELEDNVIMIRKDEHEIEVGQLMYEYIVLSLPVQRVHPVDEKGHSACNPEMIKKLRALSVNEAQIEKQGDPRWDALKDIIEKNN